MYVCAFFLIFKNFAKEIYILKKNVPRIKFSHVKKFKMRTVKAKSIYSNMIIEEKKRVKYTINIIM